MPDQIVSVQMFARHNPSLFAIRNCLTGRLLVLENDSEIGYEPYDDDPTVRKMFSLRDSEYGGEVYVTTDRAAAEALVKDGMVSLSMDGTLVIYNGQRHLNRSEDAIDRLEQRQRGTPGGNRGFQLEHLEVVALTAAA